MAFDLDTLVAKWKKKDLTKGEALEQAQKSAKKNGVKWNALLEKKFEKVWNKNQDKPLEREVALINVKVTEDHLVDYLKHSKVNRLLARNHKQVSNFGNKEGGVILTLKAFSMNPEEGVRFSIMLRDRFGADSVTADFTPENSQWVIHDATGPIKEEVKVGKAYTDGKFASLVKDLFEKLGASAKKVTMKVHKVLPLLKEQLGSLMPSFREELLAFAEDVSLDEVEALLRKTMVPGTQDRFWKKIKQQETVTIDGLPVVVHHWYTDFADPEKRVYITVRERAQLYRKVKNSQEAIAKLSKAQQDEYFAAERQAKDTGMPIEKFTKVTVDMNAEVPDNMDKNKFRNVTIEVEKSVKKKE